MTNMEIRWEENDQYEEKEYYPWEEYLRSSCEHLNTVANTR